MAKKKVMRSCCDRFKNEEHHPECKVGQKPKSFFTEDGETVCATDLEEEIDSSLQDSDRLFIRGSDGHRYLVSVRVKFVRSDEE